MSTTAKMVENQLNLKKLELHKSGKKKMRPRDLIKIRLRCRLCGRSRAVYRKFGICRICFRGEREYDESRHARCERHDRA